MKIDLKYFNGEIDRQFEAVSTEQEGNTLIITVALEAARMAEETCKIEGLNCLVRTDASLVRLVEGAGEERLDDLVHEAASEMASEANNGGAKARIRFLQDCGWTEQNIRQAL